MTLDITEVTMIHQHSGDFHSMRATHRPTGVSIQIDGHNGYFRIRNDALELLEKEVAKQVSRS